MIKPNLSPQISTKVSHSQSLQGVQRSTPTQTPKSPKRNHLITPSIISLTSNNPRILLKPSHKKTTTHSTLRNVSHWNPRELTKISMDYHTILLDKHPSDRLGAESRHTHKRTTRATHTSSKYDIPNESKIKPSPTRKTMRAIHNSLETA